MKKLKKFLICTLAAVFIQQAVFLYVENVYISRSGDMHEVEVSDSADDQLKETITLKKDIAKDNITMSPDGGYIAYMDNDNLKVYNSEDKTEKDLTKKIDGEIVYHTWTDGAEMLIVKREESKGEKYYKLVKYNAKEKEAEELVDFDKNDVKIPIRDENEKIGGITFSTASAVIYLKIDKSNGKSDLYRSNTMNQFTKVISNKQITDVELPANLGKCIMTSSGKLSILDGENINVPDNITPRILGSSLMEKTNYIYIGNEVNGKINKIYYKKLNSEDKNWQSIDLKYPVFKDDIEITKWGNMYVNYSEDSSVVDLKSEKKVKYDGEFIQFYSDTVISKDGKEITKTKIS